MKLKNFKLLFEIKPEVEPSTSSVVNCFGHCRIYASQAIG
jgi:hypothetical protein